MTAQFTAVGVTSMLEAIRLVDPACASTRLPRASFSGPPRRARSVRELVDVAFGCCGLDPAEHVQIDEGLVRGPDPVPLVGDPAKAAERLGWRATTTFEEMIEAMVEADLARPRAAPSVGAAAEVW